MLCFLCKWLHPFLYNKGACDKFGCFILEELVNPFDIGECNYFFPEKAS